MRQRFVEEGLEATLKPRPGRGRKPTIVGETEAHLVALRCSEPPSGQAQCPSPMLAERMVELDYIDQLSHESVHQVLKKNNYNPCGKLAG